MGMSSSGSNANEPIPLLDGDIKAKWSSLARAMQALCYHLSRCYDACISVQRERDMFTLGLLFWDCGSIQPCCDTRHTSNLLPFIISLYSQRPHLVCYYQRSLLFSSMYVGNPSETSMSSMDNWAILVNPFVCITEDIQPSNNSH